MLYIDKKKYDITETNRYNTVLAKTQIVLANSLRKDDYHILRLQHKEFGKTKTWNTFTISRTGKIYQHYDPKYHTDFLGIKEADKNSISIVLENMGSLFKTPENKYINWLNEICDDDEVIEKGWMGYKYWENYTEKQIKSTYLLCRRLCNNFNIPNTLIGFHHYHKEIIKFKGIVFKSNYIEDSGDINPNFNIENFNELLQNQNIEI